MFFAFAAADVAYAADGAAMLRQPTRFFAH